MSAELSGELTGQGIVAPGGGGAAGGVVAGIGAGPSVVAQGRKWGRRGLTGRASSDTANAILTVFIKVPEVKAVESRIPAPEKSVPTPVPAAPTAKPTEPEKQPVGQIAVYFKEGSSEVRPGRDGTRVKLA